MDISSWILDKCLIVVPVLNIIGSFLKSTPRVPDWSIPFALLAIGIGLCIGLSFRPECDLSIIDAIVQGVLVTGAAIFLHQGVKQVRAREGDGAGE